MSGGLQCSYSTISLRVSEPWRHRRTNTSPTPSRSCWPSEADALLAWKSHLTDADALSSWANPAELCSWLGVSCDAAGRVQSLSLRDLGLAQSLAPALPRLARPWQQRVLRRRPAAARRPLWPRRPAPLQQQPRRRHPAPAQQAPQDRALRLQQVFADAHRHVHVAAILQLPQR